MPIILKPHQQFINCHLTIPGSKSLTNRALLLAALAHGVSQIHNVLVCDDTRALIQALRALGIQIKHQGSTYTIWGCGGQWPQRHVSLDCDGAGTASRFLLATCCSAPGNYQIIGNHQLSKRPMQPLLDLLIQQGIEVSRDQQHQLPVTLKVTKPLNGGLIKLSGAVSSQFVSALLMAAPFAKKPMTLQVSQLVSAPYVNMTVALMKRFGIEVKQIKNSYSINNQQAYQACNYQIEGDYSTASYFLGLAMLTKQHLMLKGLPRPSLQADIKFIAILKHLGAMITHDDSRVIIKGPKHFSGIDIDMNDCSDVFITLACLAPFATSPTRIYNIAHTRHQESDRIQAVAMGLKCLGIKTDMTDDSLTIYPGKATAGTIDCCGDHRIAMSFAMMSVRLPGITLVGAQCVSKTCPQFFDLFEQLLGAEHLKNLFKVIILN